jgi:excisionase family DNA binding protein
MNGKGCRRELRGTIEGHKLQQALPGLDRGAIDARRPQRLISRKAPAVRYDQLPDVLTPREVQSFLRLGRNATYELLKDGTIRSVRLGQKYLIPREAVRELLGGNGESAGTGTPVKGHA